jgi:hypothetical protein
MSIFTSDELEFLTSLSRGWRRLYWNELARLLKEDDNLCDAGQPHKLQEDFPCFGFRYSSPH